MKSRFLVGIPLVAITILAGCAGSQAMRVNRTNPAASAEVETREESNGNTKISLKAEHLARPEAVDPAAATYVVWAQDLANGGEPQNLGALEVDDNLKARFEAITPLKRFDLFITPEPINTAQVPTGEKSLWTTVSQ
jgi:hypothetical protein